MRVLTAVLLLFTLPALGDQYRRQPEVDIVHYEIEVELPEEGDTISAVARLHARLQQDGVSGMRLDFVGMTIEKLQIGGREHPFTHRQGQVHLDFDHPYKAGEIAVVEVRYRGNPSGKGLLIGKNKYGRKVYFAENWPDRARYWFPSIDHPYDKATVAFSVTAPEKYDVVANGRLVETRSLLDGRRQTRWKEDVPIPTYCMVIGAAEFSVVRPGAVQGVPLLFYSYPQDARAAAQKFARTDLILEYFARLIAPYPFEKLAQVQSTTRIGGMENSSVIFYSEQGFQRAGFDEEPVPHEIAHQWFGNSVTPADWDHLWISEGFATYFSALFYEHLAGPESMKQAMARAAEAVQQFHKRRPAALIDPELTDLTKKLNPFNYQKGAWVLHMLRRILGDELFFVGIRRFYKLHAGGNATTEDFRRVMESVSGRSLEAFFRQWCYQPGWPDYRVSWRWDERAREAEIRFRQAQDNGLFDMPLDIAFTVGGRTDVRTVRVADRDQAVRIALAEPPSSVDVDPGGWVLKSVSVSQAGASR